MFIALMYMTIFYIVVYFVKSRQNVMFDHKNVNLDFLPLERPSIINSCALFFLVFFVVQMKWRDRCISAVTPFIFRKRMFVGASVC